MYPCMEGFFPCISHKTYLHVWIESEYYNIEHFKYKRVFQVIGSWLVLKVPEQNTDM